jgi:hypothetical protein
MQQILIEVPLLGYVFAPARTQQAVAAFSLLIGRKGRGAAIVGASVIGVC